MHETCPFEPKWDSPQLPNEIIKAHGPTAFEWWYFDAETDDGVELVVVFSRCNPIFARGKASLYVELRTPQTQIRRVANYPASDFSARSDGDSLRVQIAQHTMILQGSDAESALWTISFGLQRFHVDLEFRPESRGFLPAPDGRYFTSDDQRETCVSFSAPMSRVKGTLTLDGQTRSVNGIGYHDHPWGTAQLVTTNWHWQWARARTSSASVMFAQVLPDPGFSGRLEFLYRADANDFEPTIVGEITLASADWRKDHWYGIRYPHTVKVSSTAGNWSAVAQSALMDTPIYNRAAIRWRAGDDSAGGQGWIEYYQAPPRWRSIFLFGAKVAAFFWRRFPFFGQ